MPSHFVTHSDRVTSDWNFVAENDLRETFVARHECADKVRHVAATKGATCMLVCTRLNSAGAQMPLLNHLAPFILNLKKGGKLFERQWETIL